MQFLNVSRNDTLASVANLVGQRNVDPILYANDLKRAPNLGAQFYSKCEAIENNSGIVVSAKRKETLLNTLTGDAELFERASLMDEKEWRVFATLGTFPGSLRLPPDVSVPSSTSVFGGTSGSVSPQVYNKVMQDLMQNPQGEIDPAIFNSYSVGTVRQTAARSVGVSQDSSYMFSAFKIPWGKIQLYSSISGDVIDFPCYPEELDQQRAANWTEMDSIIYQYEPWYVYNSSGPRTQQLTFQFHRDMWSGDHRDGKANELIRFCESNCFPEYNGSAINAPSVKLYINGEVFISGIMTNVQTRWSGPLGLDDWYLFGELTLSITEVSETPLNYNSVREKGLIG